MTTPVFSNVIVIQLFSNVIQSLLSLKNSLVATLFFLFHSFLPPFVSDIWSSFHACFCFFFNAEFSDFQMHSPGHLNNEVNHKITRDIAGSLEIRPQQL